MNPSGRAVPLLTRCVVCGAKNLRDVEVLSAALIQTWELAPAEVDYVNAQQGRHCADCRSTLRCMALAKAILRFYGSVGNFDEFAKSFTAQRLRVLEINEAGGVSAYLARFPGRILAPFPRVDMQDLPYPNASSYHGTAADGEGYLVQTEFGADAWRWPLAAGFSELRVTTVESPAAHAWTAIP